MTSLRRIEPIWWVVESAKCRALVLERPNADAMAAKVHGQVDAVYSGAQVSALLAAAGQNPQNPPDKEKIPC